MIYLEFLIGIKFNIMLYTSLFESPLIKSILCNKQYTFTKGEYLLIESIHFRKRAISI